MSGSKSGPRLAGKGRRSGRSSQVLCFWLTDIDLDQSPTIGNKIAVFWIRKKRGNIKLTVYPFSEILSLAA